MNEFVSPLKSHYENFNNKPGELLPAFVRWDSSKNDYVKINPKENNNEIKDPEFFGDNWSEDNKHAIRLSEKLRDMCQLYSYVEITDGRKGTAGGGEPMSELYRHLVNKSLRLLLVSTLYASITFKSRSSLTQASRKSNTPTNLESGFVIY